LDHTDFETAVKSRFVKEWGLGHMDPHDLLALWWVFSQLTDEDIDEARQSLTKPPDGGVDAVRIDHESQVVHLVQSKFRESDKLEKEADLVRLTEWANKLVAADTEFSGALAGLSAVTKDRLRSARKAAKASYEVKYEFVSTGRVSKAAAGHQPAGFRFVGGKELLSLYDDYASGVRPIPTLSIRVASANAELSGGSSGVGLGIYLVAGSEIHRLTNAHPSRLFARNIRGFLGEKNPVNAAIVWTVKHEPDRFRFLNNGLTVVCDRSYITLEGGIRTLTLDNPQVVNGQQTSRSLAKVLKKEAERVEVSVRVVTISRDEVDSATYDRLVREIVEATNRQSAIPVAELRSNDKSQIDIQRAMGRLGYYYARKTGSYGEYMVKAAGRPIIVRRVMADAVAGCLEESLAHRETKSRLYEDPNFEKIFDPTQVRRNIAAWYIWRAVLARINKHSGGPSRDQGKWLALYAIWQQLWDTSDVGPDQLVSAARESGSSSPYAVAMKDLVDATRSSIDAYYSDAVKAAAAVRDPARHFKTKSLYPAYMAYLDTPAGAGHKTRVAGRIATLQNVLKATATASASK
jgi:hypothetical protein